MLLLFLAWGAAALAAEAPRATPARPLVDASGKAPKPPPPPRTISGSKQFFVFCTDPAARSQVAGYTEEIKTSLLQVLGEPDRWKYPILVTLQKVPAAQGQPPGVLSLYQYDAGLKIQIDVPLGSDPSKINLQRLLVRALLLEFSYRDQPQLVKPGQPYAEAPWWLVEGVMQIFLRRETGLDTDLFKRIVDVNRLPPIGKFLAGQPSDFDGSAVETMDQACAMCLVQLLIDQPGGRASLASLVRHWPQGTGDPIASLTREFGGLAKNEQNLQKWWTLHLARFSVADRYKGLNSDETDKQLTAALQLQIAKQGSTATQPYALSDFGEYLKLPASKDALTTSLNALNSLNTTATAFYRPLVAEYQEIVGLLQRGKTLGLKGRIAKADQLHADLHKRMTAISDYVNWFEATQVSVRSGKFEGYLKAANELAEPPPRQDPLSKYMDEQAKGR
ncbi:MAG TPA: hypothetical protein VGO11_01270 [Chthoniobacteraceae bacterium]|nr:hypothetical protein [Chthoniobacteraceae bacterium]